MRFNELNGYFDVTKYDAKKQRNERQLKADGEQIIFGVSFRPEDLPAELVQHAKQYTNKNGDTMFGVNFKIGQNVKWFRRTGHIDRPTNADLHGKRFKVWIECNILNGDPSKKEACGAWVNGIMIEESDSDMFADIIVAATPEIAQEMDDDGDLLI